MKRVADLLGDRGWEIWAAGFLDGEACIAIKRAKKGDCVRHYLRVQVSQKVREPLDILMQLFGGSVCCKKGAYRSDMFDYEVSTRDAARMLERVLPYLVVKKAQAELALAFQSRRSPLHLSDQERQQDLDDFETMKKMKHAA